MFDSLKKWLGIEGVKMEILPPQFIKKTSKSLHGSLRFGSMETQTVESVKVKIIEKYSRGRGESKLIDEYELGKIELKIPFDVVKGEVIELGFELPFEVKNSEIDEIGAKNFLLGGLVGFAKKMKGAKSEYFIVAEAKVKGTVLNPIDKKPVTLI